MRHAPSAEEQTQILSPSLDTEVERPEKKDSLLTYETSENTMELSLLLIKNLVQLHGGTIEMFEEDGRTTIVFRSPQNTGQSYDPEPQMQLAL